LLNAHIVFLQVEYSLGALAIATKAETVSASATSHVSPLSGDDDRGGGGEWERPQPWQL